MSPVYLLTVNTRGDVSGRNVDLMQVVF